jgi:hypothetical protein
MSSYAPHELAADYAETITRQSLLRACAFKARRSFIWPTSLSVGINTDSFALVRHLVFLELAVSVGLRSYL